MSERSVASAGALVGASGTAARPAMNGEATRPASSRPCTSVDTAPECQSEADVQSDGSRKRPRSPPRPDAEPLVELGEIAQQLQSYHEEQRLPSNHPDVIALRTTASILQGQRRRLLNGISDLDKLMQRAENDPWRLLHDFKTGTIVPKGQNGKHLMKALKHLDVDGTGFQPEPTKTTETEGHSSPLSDTSEDCALTTSEVSSHANVDTNNWPEPFDTARAPYIDWSNYWVCGEVLEKLHKEALAARRLSP